MTNSITDRAMEPADGLLAVRDPSRRRVLVAGGVIAAAGAVTAACGSSGASDSGGGAPRPTDSTAGSAAAATPTATIPTADIPVGGGQILTDQKVVITQPTSGKFVAFTAVCTHQGCLVASIVDAEIVCPCHASRFSIADGAVTGGPAPAPLAPASITVSGDTITLT